jgi:hypothetical protein
MTAATYSRKRYIVQCVGCGLLADVRRADSLVCCPACRVVAHRNGSMKRLRALAKAHGDFSPQLFLRASAMAVLLPGQAERVACGEVTLDDLQSSVEFAFDRLAIEIAMRRSESA